VSGDQVDSVDGSAVDDVDPTNPLRFGCASDSEDDFLEEREAMAWMWMRALSADEHKRIF